jgi:hypothetical protein
MCELNGLEICSMCSKFSQCANPSHGHLNGNDITCKEEIIIEE